MSIAITAFLINTPETFFWVTDSIGTHLPASIKLLDLMKNNLSGISFHREPGILTHSFTAIAIGFLGVNVIATVLAQTILKLLAAYYIYKIALLLWNKETALISVQIYAFCPTVFFYNLVLYKESAIHALTAAIIFYSILFFIKFKTWSSVPIIICLMLLNQERFYIAYLLFLSIILFSSNFIFKLNKKKIISLIIILFIICIMIINYKYTKLSIGDMLEKIYSKRLEYASYKDIRQDLNYEVPYFLAFIKILFTPYFSFNKFSLFLDFSTLLIWGSIVNQIVIICSLLGLRMNVTKTKTHIFIWLPFIVFLMLAAYISPWSGRLRDSFYPILSCYAGCYLYSNRYFLKFFHLNNK